MASQHVIACRVVVPAHKKPPTGCFTGLALRMMPQSRSALIYNMEDVGWVLVRQTGLTCAGDNLQT
jgi:hypothetical protein